MADTFAFSHKHLEMMKCAGNKSRRSELVMHSNDGGTRASNQQQRLRAKLAQRKVHEGASEAEIVNLMQPSFELLANTDVCKRSCTAGVRGQTKAGEGGERVWRKVRKTKEGGIDRRRTNSCAHCCRVEQGRATEGRRRGERDRQRTEGDNSCAHGREQQGQAQQ